MAMHNKGIWLGSVLLLLASFTSQAESLAAPTESQDSQQGDTLYITDNLFVHMHSGAGNNYRIIGSINAGSELTFLAVNEETGYIQVKDNRGRTGWVNKRFTTKRAGLSHQNIELKKQVAMLQEELGQLRGDVPSLRQVKGDLETENQNLQIEIKGLNDKVAELTQKRQEATDKQQKNLLIYGGGIGFIGVLLGIIITIGLSRRRRYDGWA